MTLYVDNEDIEERLAIHKVIHGNQGRTKGALAISHEEHVAAGVLGNLIGPIEAAKVVDVKASQISLLKNGIVARETGINEKLKNDVEERLGIVKDKVLDKLLKSIDAVNLDGLDEKSALESTKVVSNLAGVIDKISDKSQQTGNQVNVIVYAPKRDSLDVYDIVALPSESVK